MVFLIILSAFNREYTENLLPLKGRNFGRNGIIRNENTVFPDFHFSAGIQEQGINRELGSLKLFCWKGR